MIRGKKLKRALCLVVLASVLSTSMITAYADEVTVGENGTASVENGNMTGIEEAMTGNDGISVGKEGMAEGDGGPEGASPSEGNKTASEGMETVPEGNEITPGGNEGAAEGNGGVSGEGGTMPEENMTLPDEAGDSQESGESAPVQNDPFVDGERVVEQVTGMDENGNVYVIEDLESGVFPQTFSGRTRARSAAASVQVVNFNTKSVTLNTYFTEVGTKAEGYTNGNYGADAAYLGTYNGKVRFMLSGVVGEVPEGEVQLVNLSSAASLSHYEVGTDGRLTHKITTNMTKQEYYPSRLDNGNAPGYLQSGVRYYSYDGHYFYTYENYGLMLEDYRNGNRSHSVNPYSPYYNYFQFLPLRSQTNYTAEELNAMINNTVLAYSKMRDIGWILVEMQNKYGVNALAIAGVAANESAWGTSKYAQQRNNLFGLNAIDSNPNMASYYDSVSTCVKDFAETYMSKRYLRAGYGVYHGGFLGAKSSGCNFSYASDPYWGEKAAAVMWKLDRANGSKDANKYTIAIKDTINSSHITLNVRKESSASSTRLYSTVPQSNIAFLVLGEENGFYKIQSDPVLNSSRSGIDTSTGNYDYSRMYAYASKDYMTIVSQGTGGNQGAGGNQGGGQSPVNPTALMVYSSLTYGKDWEGLRFEGDISGTVGESRQIVGMRIAIALEGYTGGVQYSAHVQNVGWQDWKADAATAGSDSGSNRLEAIKINLTGDVAQYYDIYYRTHIQNEGWLGWAKNGEPSGSENMSYRMEAIQIRLVPKGGAAPGSTSHSFVKSQPGVSYTTHVQNIGWQGEVKDGATAGTSGQSLRLEGLKVTLQNAPYAGNIFYCTHVQDIGWQNSVANGALSGTTGKSKRLEAIRIYLDGDMARYYDVYYRVHIENYGWLAWTRNGNPAGSEGKGLRMEAMEIKLVPKGGAAPNTAGTSFVK